MKRIVTLFVLLTGTALILPGCPEEPPVDDDDDSAPIDDDDSSDDDDSAVIPDPEWAAGPDEAHITFTGGGKQLGSVMAAGFDLDADGLPDLALGTPLDSEDLVDETNRGRVYIFFGASLAEAGARDVALDADVVIVGDDDEMRVGNVVAGAGDIDGDGFDDLIVGSSTQMDTWIFFGSTLSVGGEFLVSQADRVLAAQVPECIHYVGDLDGDERDDILLANTLNSMSGNVAGRTFLISGMSLAEATEPLSVFDGFAAFPGQGPAQASGCASGPAGDVDGDGLADIMIGTQGNGEGGGPNAGKISFFTAESLLASEGGVVLLTSADWTFRGEAADDRLGTDVAVVERSWAAVTDTHRGAEQAFAICWTAGAAAAWSADDVLVSALAVTPEFVATVRAGVVHAVFHNMIGGWHKPEFNNTQVGAHAYSTDGGRCDLTRIGLLVSGARDRRARLYGERARGSFQVREGRDQARPRRGRCCATASLL